MVEGMRRILLLLSAVTIALSSATAAPALRVLIFSGQNNHDWKTTSPALAKILEGVGIPSEVTEHPDQCTSDSLAKFDVILSNWNSFGKPDSFTNCPAEARAALLQFVRGGKGFVAVHAGSSSFYDWPEYQQLGLAWWKNGQTSHGAPHAFTVTPSGDHPVARGLLPFQTTDELWMKPGVQPDAAVVAEAEGQPVALAAQFGKGRAFTLLLGHSAEFMQNAGFQTLLLRGVQWAAGAEVSASSADIVLGAVSRWEYGQNRAPLLDAARLVQAAPRDLAPRLAGLLTGGATLDAKKFACWQLGLCGSDGEVPVLAGLLGNPDLALAARNALERIPGEASLAALRNALATAPEGLRRDLILSLGARCDEKSVPALAALLPDRAAVDALGLIGSEAALRALEGAADKAPPESREAWTLATLRCAANAKATSTLEKLTGTGMAAPVRRAAFLARVDALGAAANDTISAALTGNDEILRAAALQALNDHPDPAMLARLSAGLGDLSAAVQPLLLAVLGLHGDSASLPAVTRALASNEPDIREAAFKALARLGDDTVVPALVKGISTAPESDRKPVLDALAALRGEKVNAALVSQMNGASPAAQCELIRVLVLRDATDAVGALIPAAESGDAALRQESIRALGKLAGAAHVPEMIRLLNKSVEEDRTALETALVALGKRASASAAIAQAMQGAVPATRASLATVLGALRDAESLAGLREAMKDTDPGVRTACVRSLAGWPDAAPLVDLVAAAESAQDEKTRVLALRGVARMALQDRERGRTQVTELVKRALAVASGEDTAAALKSSMAALSNANLSIGATATNPDGLKPDLEGRGPEAAIDGNQQTYWDETDDQKLYKIRVQLKKPATVRAIRIVGFKQGEYAPKDFQVLCDDKPVKSISAAQYIDNTLTVDVPPSHCAAVQLDITGYYGRSPAIRELAVLGEED
jgi:uncharacterized protein